MAGANEGRTDLVERDAELLERAAVANLVRVAVGPADELAANEGAVLAERDLAVCAEPGGGESDEASSRDESEEEEGGERDARGRVELDGLEDARGELEEDVVACTDQPAGVMVDLELRRCWS